MTRLQRVAGSLEGESSDHDRTVYMSSRLPSGAPEIVSKNTVTVSNPAEVLAWAREDRQRTFNLLVKSTRSRTSKAPLRRFTDLSARTVACYLASQDDPESQLCYANAFNISPHSFHPDAADRSSSSQHSTSQSPGSSNKPVPNSGGFRPAPTRGDTALNKLRSSRPRTHGSNNDPILEEEQTRTRKDPKSFTQNLFDTLSLRMVEWLPLKRATFYDSKSEQEQHTSYLSTPIEEPPHSPPENSPIHRDPYHTPDPSGTKSLPESKESNPQTTFANVSTPTLELKVPANPAKRSSLSELEPWKQTQRSIPEDRPKTRRKRRQKVAVDNTTSTSASPCPSSHPPPKHRQQKHRRVLEGMKVTADSPGQPSRGETSFCHPNPSSIPESSIPNEAVGATRAHSNNQSTESESLESEASVPTVESLSHLSRDIVDGLGDIMFKSQEDLDAWEPEIAALDLRGYSEHWEWNYATHQQRLAFPYITQSIFYSLSNPKHLLLSFRQNSTKLPEQSQFPFPQLDMQSLEDTFRKIHEICPWQTTLHSLWVCLEKLFIPPKELTIPTKQRRSSRTSTSSQLPSPGFQPQQAGDYVIDSEAAHIAVITLYALVSGIPQLDPPTWEALRGIRSSGEVLPDSNMRRLRSKASAQLIIDASDRFEHDLALRLVRRLSRVFSTRLAFHEVAKSKASRVIADTGKKDKCELIEQVMLAMQQSHKIMSEVHKSSATWPPERPTTLPMVVVEWLRTVLLKEWNGDPEFLKSSAAGGAIQLLSFLYRDRAKLGLEPEDFHTHFFAARLDPLEMPIAWLDFLGNNRTIHLLSYSFIFPPSALLTYFRALNHATMSKSFETAATTAKHVSQMMFPNAIAIQDSFYIQNRLAKAMQTFLVLTVRREYVLVDALDQLWRREKRELFRPLKVRMGMDEGEEGVDQGGVQQEFFRVLLAEALDPGFGMFTSDSRSGMYFFQPCPFEPLYKFELLGLLVSLALYNGVTLPVNFPVAFYRKLLGLKVKTTDHIRDGWPELSKGLDDMLSWEDGDVGDIFLRTYEFSFEAFGAVISIDMERTGRDEPWPAPERYASWEKAKQKLSDHRAATKRPSHSDRSGSSSSGNVSMLQEYATDPRPAPVVGILKGAPSRQQRPSMTTEPQPEASLVTNNNRKRFVKDYIFWLTDKSIRPQYEAFSRGFFTCLDRTALSIFSPEVLKTVVEGIQEIDINELQKHAKYEGGFEPKHAIIQEFWRIVKKYPHEKKARLLEFVTASDRVPVNGVGNMMFVIQRNGMSDARLPTSQTCFGRLLLPQYSCKSVLEERLDKALENCKGFGAV
ncbi:hypothetical protein FQN57_001388 [Myotisia sp. PD_48]|nr:hypothetical protein FQN57_001388 [Myotisia sp. PD_48]